MTDTIIPNDFEGKVALDAEEIRHGRPHLLRTSFERRPAYTAQGGK